MANPISNFLSHASNIFGRNRKPDINEGGSTGYDPGRRHYVASYGGERTIIQSIYSRLTIDATSYPLRHVKVDEDDVITEYIKDSSLDILFNFSANIDQTGRHFRQDIISTLINDGVLAIVPVDTELSLDSHNEGTLIINTARVGKIQTWYPSSIDVELYNDRNGTRQAINIEKTKVCIIQNPFYSIMNQSNSTVKRLVHKLNVLDVIDKQSSSGKLDIIIQLPYTIKSEARKQQAEERRARIEEQMSNSQYGVAYVDAAEKITQLNRPAENNLMNQIEYLTRMLYSQLGITESILDGTADESVMLNYFNRMIEPILSAITEEVERTWIGKNARTRGQRFRLINDPLKWVKASSIGEMVEGLARNEIFSSDETRAIFGRLPKGTPRSSGLINKQISENATGAGPVEEPEVKEEEEDDETE